MDFVLRRTRKEGGRWSVDDWLFVSTLGKMSSTQQKKKKKKKKSLFFLFLVRVISFEISLDPCAISSHLLFFFPIQLISIWNADCELLTRVSVHQKRGSQQPPPSRKDPRPSSSRIIISFFLFPTLMKKSKENYPGLDEDDDDRTLLGGFWKIYT